MPGGNILCAFFLNHKQVSLTSCQSMELLLVKWTLVYTMSPSELFCDGVTGKHVLLIEKEAITKLPDPLMLPFPEALYIQAKAKTMKVHVFIVM